MSGRISLKRVCAVICAVLILCCALEISFSHLCGCSGEHCILCLLNKITKDIILGIVLFSSPAGIAVLIYHWCSLRNSGIYTQKLCTLVSQKIKLSS